MDNETNAKWWLFINWLWEMCRSEQRFWEHPKSDDDVSELKEHFEETYPGWKRGGAVLTTPAQGEELPAELPF